jgi:hypothetical protein
VQLISQSDKTYYFSKCFTKKVSGNKFYTKYNNIEISSFVNITHVVLHKYNTPSFFIYLLQCADGFIKGRNV